MNFLMGLKYSESSLPMPEVGPDSFFQGHIQLLYYHNYLLIFGNESNLFLLRVHHL